MTPQERFIAALNVAFHPATKEGDILAATRGAARLLRGETVAGFLRFAEAAELQGRLAASEAKLEGAVDYCNELKVRIQRLEAEFAKPAAPPSPKPDSETSRAATSIPLGKFTQGEAIWLSGVLGGFAVCIIGALIVGAQPAVTAKLSRPVPMTAQTPAVRTLPDSNPATCSTCPPGRLPNGQPVVFRDGKFVPLHAGQ